MDLTNTRRLLVMSEQKKQNLANSSVRKDLLLICLTEKLSEIGRNLPKDTLKQLPDDYCLVFIQDIPVTMDKKIRENI